MSIGPQWRGLKPPDKLGSGLMPRHNEDKKTGKRQFLKPKTLQGTILSETTHSGINSESQALRARLSIISNPFDTLQLPTVKNPHKRDPYLLTNETGVEATLESLHHLSQQPGDGSRLHMGFSGMVNLNMIAASKSDAGLMLDVSIGTEQLWALVLPLISRSETPKEFLQLLKAAIEGKEAYYFHINSTLPQAEKSKEVATHLKQLDAECELAHGWLSSKENYDHIKQLVSGNKLQFRLLDLNDKDRVEQLKGWIDEQSLVVSSLYISNILDWFETLPMLQREERQAKMNVSQLCTKETLIIDANGEPDTEEGVRQCHYPGSEFNDRRPLSSPEAHRQEGAFQMIGPLKQELERLYDLTPQEESALSISDNDYYKVTDEKGDHYVLRVTRQDKEAIIKQQLGEHPLRTPFEFEHRLLSHLHGKGVNVIHTIKQTWRLLF